MNAIVPNRSLADAIDAVLPQTQCRKCGYPGCRPYAEAVARRDADINRCPPGGDEAISEMARLLGVPAKTLDPSVGSTMPQRVAFIVEEQCIGCTLCIQACPTDAIVGAVKLMHTVIADACTGCELCVAPCPVDCIRLLDVPPVPDRRAAAANARRRFDARTERLERLLADKAPLRANALSPNPAQRKQQTIARALERARTRLTKTRG